MKANWRIVFAALALCAVFVLVGCERKNFNDNGADIEAMANALVQAAKENDAEETRRLIEEDVDVNAIDDKGKTALMFATEKNSVDVAKILIAAGANINAKENEYGETALMYAAAQNALDVAKLLIEAGTNINAKNYGGKTALMLAEENDAADVIELLKVAGTKE